MPYEMSHVSTLPTGCKLKPDASNAPWMALLMALELISRQYKHADTPNIRHHCVLQATGLCRFIGNNVQMRVYASLCPTIAATVQNMHKRGVLGEVPIDNQIYYQDWLKRKFTSPSIDPTYVGHVLESMYNGVITLDKIIAENRKKL